MPCHLDFTDDRFVFLGKSYPDVPLLVDSKHRFVEPVCDYLRYLVTHEHLKITSVKTYADYLLHFWRHIENKNITFSDVSDRVLLGWFNQQSKNHVSELTQASRCDIVFALFVWLEVNGYVQDMVRIPGHNDSEHFAPKLTAISARTNLNLSRTCKFGIISAVRPRASKSRHQITPTSNDITSIYIAADTSNNIDMTERNHLLIDWYVQVGLRRMEWVALTVRQIPNWDVIDHLRQNGESHELRLIETKGGRMRHVGVLPELLEKTREYIEGARLRIVERFRQAKPKNYHDPMEVFLSNKTGQALDLISVTNLLTNWFKNAEVDGHGHRLRAAYLTNLFEAEIAADESRLVAHPGTKISIDYELILRKVAERAGHSNITSLRPYLVLARKRRARSPENVDMVTLQQKIEAMRQEVALLENRIKEKREILQVPVPPSRKKCVTRTV